MGEFFFTPGTRTGGFTAARSAPNGNLFLVECGTQLKPPGSTTHQLQRMLLGGSSVSSHDHTTKQWSTATRQCFRAFEGHSGTVAFCSFSPSGHGMLALQTTRLWQCERQPRASEREPPTKPSPTRLTDGTHVIGGHGAHDGAPRGTEKTRRVKFGGSWPDGEGANASLNPLVA
jgi:hypothetical protein